MNGYIEQLRKLEIYDAESKEEHRRLGMLNISTEMLQALTDESYGTSV